MRRGGLSVIGCLLVCLWTPAAETPPVPPAAEAASLKPEQTAAYRPGVWVSYRVTSSAGQLYFPLAGDGGLAPAQPPQIFDCRFTIVKNENGRLRVALTIEQQGLGTLENLILEDFTAEKIINSDGRRKPALASGVPAEYSLPARSAETEPLKIPAVRYTLHGAGKKIDLWNSREVPFGVLKIVCGDFLLELTGYGW